MDDEYFKYRYSACKKPIKSQVVTCKTCVKFFYHSECVSKHKVYDRNHEVVPCHGPFEKFIIDNDKEADIKKTSTSTGSNRDRLGSTGSVGSVTIPNSRNRTAGTSRSSDIDIKIDWLVRIVKEMKDEREGS